LLRLSRAGEIQWPRWRGDFEALVDLDDGSGLGEVEAVGRGFYVADYVGSAGCGVEAGGVG
jgi:hypothetical protein